MADQGGQLQKRRTTLFTQSLLSFNNVYSYKKTVIFNLLAVSRQHSIAGKKSEAQNWNARLMNS